VRWELRFRAPFLSSFLLEKLLSGKYKTQNLFVSQDKKNRHIVSSIMSQHFSDKLINFYQSLKPPKNIPDGISVLFPQQNKEVMELVKIFFNKFFNDNKSRRLIFGINPGRFGAGTTGVNFTGPKQLKEFCGIDHHFKNHSELSAEFIYQMISKYDGVKKF
jgi:hypothetical protein